MSMDNKTKKYVERRIKLSSLSGCYFIGSWIEKDNNNIFVAHLNYDLKEDDKNDIIYGLSQLIDKSLSQLDSEYRVVNEYVVSDNNKQIHFVLSSDNNRMEWYGLRKRLI